MTSTSRARSSFCSVWAKTWSNRAAAASSSFPAFASQVVEPGQGIYAATKAGVVQMVRELAAELAPHGVRANCIAPGVVETPLTGPSRRGRTGTTPTPSQGRAQSLGPAPRNGGRRDLSRLVRRFLCHRFIALRGRRLDGGGWAFRPAALRSSERATLSLDECHGALTSSSLSCIANHSGRQHFHYSYAIQNREPVWRW